MKRSELKQIIREVIEEGKKNLDGPGSYTTPVEVGEFTITGWGRDTNGNSVIKYSFIEDGKEKNKSSQLGGLIGPLNDSEYKDREKGPGKKLIAAFKEAIDKEWISVPKRLKGKKVEESKVLPRRRIVQEESDKKKNLVDILKGNKTLVNKINNMINDYSLDLFDSVEAVAKRNLKDFGGLDIDEVVDQIKTLKKYDTRKGLVMEESKVLPRRRIIQEAVQTPKSLKKVASKLKKIVTDNYPDIMSLADLPVPLQNKLEAEADHELFWQDADRYIGDLYNELGR